MRLNLSTRYLLAAAITFLPLTGLRANDPPLALLPDNPPSAVVTPAKYDAKAAAVGVQWKKYLGSGTCIASENGASLVLTCNHVFAEQPYPGAPFPLAAYPLAAWVTHGGTEYKAVALAGDERSDLALVIVDAPLPVARIAASDPPEGAAVRHYGRTSKETSGKVLPLRTEYTSPAARFTFTAAAIEGDSGAGVFNEDGELVAVVCGRIRSEATAPGRGTTVSIVRTVVTTHSGRLALFPRLRAKLDARKAATTVTVQPVPPAAVLPTAPAPKKAEPPKADVPKKVSDVLPAPVVPTVTYRQVTYRDNRGRTFTQWEAVSGTGASACGPRGCPIR